MEYTSVDWILFKSVIIRDFVVNNLIRAISYSRLATASISHITLESSHDCLNSRVTSVANNSEV